MREQEIGGLMRHRLKIKQIYLCRILEGVKTFEICNNDRDFQVGDTIRFLPLKDERYNAYDIASPIPEYVITYILSDAPGLQQHYVALSISPKSKTS